MPSSRPFWTRVLSLVGQHGALVALLVLITFMSIRDPSFLNPDNVLNVLRQASFVGIVAIGMTFVITAGGIDLSVGSMVALVGGLGVLAANRLMENDASSISARTAGMGVIVITAGLAGLINGLIVRKFRLAPFIATLATMAIFRSAIVALADGGQIRAQVPNFEALGAGGVRLPFAIGDGHPVLHYPIIAFVLTACVGWFILHKTTLGVNIRAVGDNEAAARYAGVKTDATVIATYTIVGLCAGVAAMLVTSRMNSVSSASAGLYYELDAIAAVVIGGTALRGGHGRIFGTVVGVLLMQVVGNMLNRLDVSPNLQGMVKGFIILLAVLIQRIVGPAGTKH
jgi:ribose transport system permease protein